MYRNYYNQKPISPQAAEHIPPVRKEEVLKPTLPEKAKEAGPLDFLKSLAIDDIILLIIIFLLLTDDESDKTLLAVLGFLFISGF